MRTASLSSLNPPIFLFASSNSIVLFCNSSSSSRFLFFSKRMIPDQTVDFLFQLIELQKFHDSTPFPFIFNLNRSRRTRTPAPCNFQIDYDDVTHESQDLILSHSGGFHQILKIVLQGLPCRIPIADAPRRLAELGASSQTLRIPEEMFPEVPGPDLLSIIIDGQRQMTPDDFLPFRKGRHGNPGSGQIGRGYFR